MNHSQRQVSTTIVTRGPKRSS